MQLFRMLGRALSCLYWLVYRLYFFLRSFSCLTPSIYSKHFSLRRSRFVNWLIGRRGTHRRLGDMNDPLDLVSDYERIRYGMWGSHDAQYSSPLILIGHYRDDKFKIYGAPTVRLVVMHHRSISLVLVTMLFVSALLPAGECIGPTIPAILGAFSIHFVFGFALFICAQFHFWLGTLLNVVEAPSSWRRIVRKTPSLSLAAYLLAFALYAAAMRFSYDLSFGILQFFVIFVIFILAIVLTPLLLFSGRFKAEELNRKDRLQADQYDELLKAMHNGRRMRKAEHNSKSSFFARPRVEILKHLIAPTRSMDPAFDSSRTADALQKGISKQVIRNRLTTDRLWAPLAMTYPIIGTYAMLLAGLVGELFPKTALLTGAVVWTGLSAWRFSRIEIELPKLLRHEKRELRALPPFIAPPLEVFQGDSLAASFAATNARVQSGVFGVLLLGYVAALAIGDLAPNSSPTEHFLFNCPIGDETGGATAPFGSS